MLSESYRVRLQELAGLEQLPTRKIGKVFHVGTMDFTKKNRNSYEGSGLSVSLHPEEWQQINPHTSGDLFVLVNPKGAFLDFHKLNKVHRETIMQFGLSEGLIEQKVTYRVYVGGGGYMEFEDAERASSEASGGFGTLRRNRKGIVATKKLVDLAHRNDIEPVSVFDLLVTVYTEMQTDLDGIWWNDRLDVHEYSAPRGVIFNSRLKSWKVQKID